jgi:hypothetical protein
LLRVAGAAGYVPERMRETVATETPARSATSRMVVWRVPSPEALALRAKEFTPVKQFQERLLKP